MVVRPRPAMDCDELLVVRAHRAPSLARHWDKRSNDDCQVKTHDGQVNAVTAASADGRRAFAGRSILCCILLLFYRYCIFFIRRHTYSVFATYLIRTKILYYISPLFPYRPPRLSGDECLRNYRISIFHTNSLVVAGIPAAKRTGQTPYYYYLRKNLSRPSRYYALTRRHYNVITYYYIIACNMHRFNDVWWGRYCFGKVTQYSRGLGK